MSTSIGQPAFGLTDKHIASKHEQEQALYNLIIL